MISLEEFVDDVAMAFRHKISGAPTTDNWEIANGLVKKFGGNALNAAGASGETADLLWTRVSMSDAWLNVYLDQKYYEVDPLLKALNGSIPEYGYNTGVLTSKDTENSLEIGLNQDIRGFGYGSLFSSTFIDAKDANRIIVVHCSEMSLSELDGEIGLDRIRLLQAMIAANIQVPEIMYADDPLRLRRHLSPREVEVLKWLASGLRNDEIAYKMNVAEVTVRKTIAAARQKLNARTREQAIAIAIRDGWITL
ncbi:LuxR family transcriptional regulator [Hoeflea sp.]|uniref:helix-turn-helix transcriptional regulator n=1 Tax=Hoeflea sp. TaxID=1940281 RepID=UPI00199EF73A|nr:LuxR family transcriptional regulator [Hoeflea sp.]MBC7281875.1 hypothetical protein [Hoeflea sp.]